MKKINADINAVGDDWVQVTLSGPEARLLRESDIEHALNGGLTPKIGDRIQISTEAFGPNRAFRLGATGTVTNVGVMVVMDHQNQPGMIYEGEFEIISETPLEDENPEQ